MNATIRGTVPPELEVSFEAIWRADDKDSSCSYYENVYLRFEGAPFAYTVALPLPALRQQGLVIVPVVLDHFLPGRCGWQLSTIRMWASDRKAPAEKMDIYHSTHRKSSSSNADLWCRKARRPGDNEDRVFCSFYNPALRGKVTSPSSLALGADATSAGIRVHYDQ